MPADPQVQVTPGNRELLLAITLEPNCVAEISAVTGNGYITLHQAWRGGNAFRVRSIDGRPLQNGTTYNFEVVAVNSNDANDRSNPVTASGTPVAQPVPAGGQPPQGNPVARLLPAPKIKVIGKPNGGVLQCSAIQGAESYLWTEHGGMGSQEIPSRSTTAVIDTMVAGDEKFITVRAIDVNGVAGSESDGVTLKVEAPSPAPAPTISPLETPSGLRGIVGPGQLEVFCNRVKGADRYEWTVSPPTLNGESVIESLSPLAVLQPLRPGYDHVIFVTAFRGNEESARSAPVTLKPEAVPAAPAPPAPPAAATTTTAAPAQTQAQAPAATQSGAGGWLMWGIAAAVIAILGFAVLKFVSGLKTAEKTSVAAVVPTSTNSVGQDNKLREQFTEVQKLLKELQTSKLPPIRVSGTTNVTAMPTPTGGIHITVTGNSVNVGAGSTGGLTNSPVTPHTPSPSGPFDVKVFDLAYEGDSTPRVFIPDGTKITWEQTCEPTGIQVYLDGKLYTGPANWPEAQTVRFASLKSHPIKVRVNYFKK